MKISSANIVVVAIWMAIFACIGDAQNASTIPEDCFDVPESVMTVTNLRTCELYCGNNPQLVEESSASVVESYSWNATEDDVLSSNSCICNPEYAEAYDLHPYCVGTDYQMEDETCGFLHQEDCVAWCEEEMAGGGNYTYNTTQQDENSIPRLDTFTCVCSGGEEPTWKMCTGHFELYVADCADWQISNGGGVRVTDETTCQSFCESTAPYTLGRRKLRKLLLV